VIATACLNGRSLRAIRAATMQSIIRFLRLAMQSMILGLGAYLVIERLATVGAMFAASILLGRALQPVGQIVGSWRNLVSARGAFLRIRELLKADPQREAGLTLPRPKGRLSVEGLTYVPPLSSKPILRGNVRNRAGRSTGRHWSFRASGNPRFRVIWSVCLRHLLARCDWTGRTSRAGSRRHSASMSVISPRRIGSAPGPVIAGVYPEPAGLGAPAAGIKHPDRRVIGK
jgi:hypothetical protein